MKGLILSCLSAFIFTILICIKYGFNHYSIFYFIGLSLFFEGLAFSNKYILRSFDTDYHRSGIVKKNRYKIFNNSKFNKKDSKGSTR